MPSELALAASTAASPTDTTERDGAILRLVAVTKAYADTPAVRGVDLELRRGEIVCLLGPSGCGKTTTLRAIVGLERVDTGQILYDGRTLDNGRSAFVPTHRRNMGIVFQNYAIWPHMTVAENVAYPLRVRRVSRERRAAAVAAAIELVGLGGLADRKTTALSGGQQQRVALARALVFQPQLLLLDEPFSNLDAALRDGMRAEVKLLQRQLGISVLFVTHDQHEALSVADRIAVMSDGRIEQFGEPEELYDRPGSRMVRDFLGTTLVCAAIATSVDGETTRLTLGDDLHSPATMTVKTPPGLAVGDRCEVSIRTEYLTVKPAGSAPVPENTITGLLRTRLFVGYGYEAHIQIGPTRHVKTAAPDGVADGETVWLHLPQERIRTWA